MTWSYNADRLIIKFQNCFIIGMLLVTTRSNVSQKHHRFLSMSYRAYNIATNTAPSLALVTGGKSGIGKAVAQKIAALPFIEKVLVVSRSITEADVAGNPKFVAVAADVGTPEGRDTIIHQVKALDKPLKFLVHSAGTIDPIKSVLDVTQDEFQNAWTVNVQGPFLLTTALYPYLAECQQDTSTCSAGRVLHVSSGAAHGPPPVGWSVYGITKAAFYQSFKVLDGEFSHLGGKVRVGSFKPGVVDTPMQGIIRDAPHDAMPLVASFQTMKAKAVAVVAATQARVPPTGALDAPENVAFFAEWLLLGTTDDEFANRDDPNEYDIRNAALYPKWIPKENLPKDE
jgi:NAD(P)-dependent dehydrogenase (short-subunit alcohol dehydrogenase family)